MLATLESRLLARLQQVHGNAVEVIAGPVNISSGGREGVSVTAHRWRTLEADDPAHAPDARREPAYFMQTVGWDTDGSVTEFMLPEGAGHALVVVEAPPGVVRKADGEYDLHDRTIAFFRPPPAGRVLARLRGDPARGFHDRRPAIIELSLATWANDMSTAEALFATSLPAVLTALADMPNLEADYPPDTGVSLRMSSPVATLEGVDRELTNSDRSYRMAARLRVRGQVELCVAAASLGPAEVGTIEHIEYQASVTEPDAAEQP